MSLLTYFSAIITSIFIYNILKEKYKIINHHITIHHVLRYFKTECAYKKDIDYLRMVFKLPFIPFNIYKHMSKRCKDLYNLGKNNSITTKKIIVLLLQLQHYLRHTVNHPNPEFFITPKTKDELFKQMYTMIKYCEHNKIKITRVFDGNEDIYEIMATLAKEI